MLIVIPAPVVLLCDLCPVNCFLLSMELGP